MIAHAQQRPVHFTLRTTRKSARLKWLILAIKSLLLQVAIGDRLIHNFQFEIKGAGEQQDDYVQNKYLNIKLKIADNVYYNYFESVNSQSVFINPLCCST